MSSALLSWTYYNSSPNSSKVLHAKKGLVIIYIASAGLLKEKTAAGRQGGGGWEAVEWYSLLAPLCW